MKRFPSHSASISAGRRAVAALTGGASASLFFTSTVQQSQACYSSQTTKAFASSKAKGGAAAGNSTATAPVPGSAAALSSPAAAATQPASTQNRNSSSSGGGGGRSAPSSGRGRRPSAVAEPCPTQPTPPTSGARGRRGQHSSSGPSSERRVRPMRGRRATEPPRVRRTTRQKAVALLQSCHVEGTAADNSAPSHTSAPLVEPATASASYSSPVLPSSAVRENGGEAVLQPAAAATKMAAPASLASGASVGAEADVKSLTTEQLLSRLQLTTFVERVTSQVRDWAAAVKEWAHPSSDPTLREWERQLLLSLRKESFADCTVVQYAMQQRYEDHFGSSSRDVAFLTLYARVLMNNAVFCLLNFVTYRATELLNEALEVARRASELKEHQQQPMQTKTAVDGAAGSSEKRSPQTVQQLRPSTDPEHCFVFLRVLLANAYASDQQYWKAAEQYQLVLSALERSPLWSPEQVAPGPVSPIAVSQTFAEEDARLFYADAARVDHAVAQGTAQLLLLQSQGVAGNAVRLMHAQLAMARLHRHAGRHAESQSFYESYLDGAAEHMEGEDVAGVMLELGRLLLYKESNEEAALVYLEAASSMLLEDAQDLLQAAETSGEGKEESGRAALRIAAGNTAQRTAGSLVDTAMAYHAQGKTGKAIGLLEGSLQLLDAAGLRLLGGWVREQYADMLATVSLVDRALEEYSRAMEMLRDECGDVVEQLGPGGRLVDFTSYEVEGHLAFCLQTYVGDHRRAMAHFRSILQATYRASPAVRSAQARLSKRARRHRAGAAAAVVSSSSLAAGVGRRSGGGGGGRTRDSRSSSSSGASSVDMILKPDVLHWVLTNYVACCERVGAHGEAVGAQNRLIEIEGALGGNVVDSYLKLIALHQEAGEVEKTLALCFYVFFLPDAMMPAQTRLEVANCFASSCHQMGNNRMGAVLMQAVQHVRGDFDANALVHYAMCLKALDPADRLQLDGMMDIEAGIQAIGRVFRRAASIVAVDTALDAMEEAGSEKGSWSQSRVDRVLNGLIVLSRGAFFFHQNRFNKDAADLYAHALEQVDHITSTIPVLTEALQREMGILLVNYATLKAPEDATFAAQLYERAAAVCPSYPEVSEVVADFFVQSGDYTKGWKYMTRVLRSNPAAAAEMHLRLARLGTGSAWDTLSFGQRVDVVEHLLKGLGVSAERIASARTLALQRQMGHTSSDSTDGATATTAAATPLVISLKDFAPLLMDGVANTMSEEAVCLATYIVQTRFQEPQLLNRLYRRALLRFPTHATILVNYATLCMYAGYHVLARKYIAKAFAASSADLNCTMCYAHYLCRSYEDQQVGSAEALYRGFLERHPNVAQAHAAYANFMTVSMPTPFKTEEHFQRALELGPRTEDVLLQYGQFMWACTDSRNVYTNDDVRHRLFDRVEQLFKEAVATSPNSFTACHQLGTFYANRHNRFEDAMTMLYRAHKLQPGNVEVLRHILNTLHEECVRVQREEQRQSGTVAGQASSVAMAASSSPSASSSSRLRSLTSATKDMFDNVVAKEPNDTATLERYARFAVETLKDPRLAARLYSRIQELNRK